MKTEIIGKNTVKIYDSIEELPIFRFHKYNKMLLIDSGVGSDLEDVNAHIDRAMKFIKSDPGLAVIELLNLKQNIHLINEELSPKYMAFSALVHEINGKECIDLSEDGLKQVHDKLNQTPKGIMDCFIEAVKKKMDSELTLYFPDIFSEVGIKEQLQKLRDRTLLILNSILDGNDRGKQIEQIDNHLLSLAKPKMFSGRESAEIQFDKLFEDMNLMLTQNLNVNPKTMTTFEYYNSFGYLKKILKAK